MNASLDMLTALCRSVVPSPAGAGVPVGLLLAGLAGSAVHCVPMCGPFVIGQVGDRMACIPVCALRERHRTGAGLLWPYHLGRIATYAGLGVLAGGMGAALGRLAWFDWLATALLALAAILFLGQALQRMPVRFAMSSSWPSGWPRPADFLTRHLRRRPGRGFTLGLALGFLPCGFLYSALTAAAATSDPLLAGMAMLAFGIGTVPALVLVGVAGEAVSRNWLRRMVWASPAILVVNAALLAAMAWQRLSQMV
jgi:sulfite exporter TauE/SafE